MGERADAVRNRAAVLRAAEDLFRRDDLEHVTLARIADAAGVGKATVLRRFGDLTGVVEAVIAPRVTALRDALRTGNPPLGPGGRPPERLHAYLDALLDFVLDNRALIRALENRRPHAYYANPASRFWIDELGRRIHAAHPDADADYLAHAVFTALRADVIDYLRTDRRMSTDRIRAGLHALVTR
ncbi:TetR/AcrR family transcriptional regulator [Pseudonocardia acaciae]|uniref:TetR/AcrR family transcriptional regulator n=1 Tax=Pseudonocardia acaciae TaxID=551276 RepID=UPI00048C0916|nr:helix-turn-helix domain-containing protein [Pseudonocardia acaciae]